MVEFSLPKRYGIFNLRGTLTLYKKECTRFVAVWQQTLAGPSVSALLFLFVFTIAIPRSAGISGNIAFPEFLAPGLIIMTALQNAFANTSSSILVGKIQRNLHDVLMSPITAFEFTLAYMMGGMTRGILVAIFTGIVMSFFTDTHIQNIFSLLFYSIFGTMMLALLGIVSGLWAEKFDHIASATNFVIMPLTFFSGTFYSIERLPAFFQNIAHYNPVFYIIDGFRSGFIGQAESHLLGGAIALIVINILLFLGTWMLIRRGYKIKS